MTDHTPLTEQQLTSIEARANAATAGPWCTDSWEIYQGGEYEPGISTWIGETCRGMTSLDQDRADAAFVAAAREDVPTLLAEVRRLRAELAAVRVQSLLDLADRADPKRPEVSFFGDWGGQVGAWVRKQAEYEQRRTAAAPAAVETGE